MLQHFHAGHNVILVHGFVITDLVKPPTTAEVLSRRKVSPYWQDRAEGYLNWSGADRLEGGIETFLEPLDADQRVGGIHRHGDGEGGGEGEQGPPGELSPGGAGGRMRHEEKERGWKGQGQRSQTPGSNHRAGPAPRRAGLFFEPSPLPGMEGDVFEAGGDDLGSASPGPARLAAAMQEDHRPTGARPIVGKRQVPVTHAQQQRWCRWSIAARAIALTTLPPPST